MTATQPTGAIGRATITVVMAATAGLAFTFSFGNVWSLALRLGIARPIAPLIAPMVDLSVVGLLVALHYLSATGTSDELRSVTRLLHLCGLLTLALNTAEPVIAQHYGRAFLDAVAPSLLLGWGHVGPIILRRLHTPATAVASSPSAPVPEPSQHMAGRTIRHAEGALAVGSATADSGDGLRPASDPALVMEAEAEQDPTTGDELVDGASERAPVNTKRTGRRPAASMDELAEIVRPAVEAHGPTQAVIKTALREVGVPIASDRLGRLTQRFKNEQAAQQAKDQDEPSAALRLYRRPPLGRKSAWIGAGGRPSRRRQAVITGTPTYRRWGHRKSRTPGAYTGYPAPPNRPSGQTLSPNPAAPQARRSAVPAEKPENPHARPAA